MEDCRDRSIKDREDINTGKKIPHNHTGNTNKWDLVQCITDVSALPDGSFINFSHLARQHGILSADGEPLKNGGQILKDALIDSDVNLDRLQYLVKSTNEFRIRCKKIRLSGGIAMPCEPTNEQVIEELKKKLHLVSIPWGKK